jgi:type I restriction enzyme S subunit
MAGESAAISDRGWLYHPEYPQHWERCQLYAMARWVNGLVFRDIQFAAAGLPVIKIAEIKGGISGQTKFTQQTFDESVHIRPGDLLFSWSGQPETSIDAFWWRGPEGWLNQHVFRVTPADGIDPTFFYYLLRYLKPNFVGIARNKQTTGLGHVTKRDLENIDGAYPEPPEQRAIAHILGTLDDKIELNQRMNETLAAMARALFKSWFVDFDPVRAKAEGRDPGLPKLLADHFPDSLEDSELGAIPKGWEVKPLDEIAHFQNGLALQKYRPKTGEARLPVVKIAQLRSGHADSGEWATAKLRPECVIDDGDIVFSWSGSLLVRIWCGGRAALNQHLFKVTSGKYPRWFFLDAIRFHLPEFRRIAAGKATTMGHIQRHHLAHALCVVPDDDLLAAASPLFSGLVDRSVANDVQCRTLGAVRDTLLPRLISGELRIDDPERFLEQAAA